MAASVGLWVSRGCGIRGEDVGQGRNRMQCLMHISVPFSLWAVGSLVSMTVKGWGRHWWWQTSVLQPRWVPR